MGMMKHYLQTLICLCSDEQFGQDAVEWAILAGRVKLSYELDADLRLIMGEPPPMFADEVTPEQIALAEAQRYRGLYDELCESYQQHCAANRDKLVASYAPLFAEILKAA